MKNVFEKFRRFGSRQSVLGLLAVALIVVGAVLVAGRLSHFITIPDVFASDTPRSAETVAVVGGVKIPRMEVDGLVAAGMDPAIARDAVIQRAVLALAADREYALEAGQAADAVSRDAKAQVYLAKKTDSLVQAVTDEDISAWYAKNIHAENYQQLKIRFYQTASLDDAVEVVRAANAGDRAAIAKFGALANTPDGFLPVNDVPYDLGRLVAKQKPGVFSAPVTVRTGALSMVLDEVRAKEPPTLAELKGQIKQILVRTRLADEIAKLRAAQKVELRG